MLTTIQLPAIDNPLDGVLPDFTVFGVQFTELWQKLLGGAWGISIVLAVLFIILAAVKMSTASAGQNTMEYAQARKQFQGALIALGILAALAVIVGAVLSFFS